jgi:hypothetical protein
MESFSRKTADCLLLWKLGVLKICFDALVDDQLLTCKLERCSTVSVIQLR